MKKNKLILLPVFLLGVFFSSCDQENITTIYDDGGVSKAAFPSKVMTVSMAPEDQNTIKVPIYRTNTTGTEPQIELTFATTTTNANGVFTMPNKTVTFAEGSAVAYAEIKYPSINSLSPTANYVMTVTIGDSTKLSPTLQNKITITAARKLTFENIGTGKFTSTFFEETWDQPVQKAVEGEVYKLMDCYVTGYHIIFSVNDDNSVSFGAQQTGYVHSSYGMITFTPFQSTGAVIPGSAKNGKTVTLAGRFTVSAGSFGIFTETMVLP
jgi:hypothetical protein